MKKKFIRNRLPPELVFLFLAVSITLLGDSSLYVLLPIHAANIGVPVGMVGVLLSVNRFVRLFTNYAVSKLNDRLGSRIMIIASVVFASLTTLVYGLPAGLAAFFLSRVVWGFCWSTLRFESFSSIAQNIGQRDRGRASGLFHSITRIGSLAALLIGGVLVEWVGYRMTFYIFALATLMLGLMAILFWNRSRAKRHRPDLESETAVVDEPASTSTETEMAPSGIQTGRAFSISRPHFYAFTLINGWIGSGLLVTTVGYIMMLKFGQKLPIFGLTVGISMAASFITSSNWFYSIFLSVVFGRMSDKYGRARMLTGLGMSLAVSLFLIAYAPWPPLFALAATASFAATVGLNAILTAITIDHHCHKGANLVIAHQTTINDLGSALGALFGYLLVVSIGYQITYVISLSILLALILSLQISKR